MQFETIKRLDGCVHLENYNVTCLWKRDNASLVKRDIFIAVKDPEQGETEKQWVVVSDAKHILAFANKSAHPADATWKHSSRNPKFRHTVTVTRKDPKKNKERCWFGKAAAVPGAACPHCELLPGDKRQDLSVDFACEYKGGYVPCENFSWKRVNNHEELEHDVFLTCDCTTDRRWMFVRTDKTVLERCRELDVKHPADADWSWGEIHRVNF